MKNFPYIWQSLKTRLPKFLPDSNRREAFCKARKKPEKSAGREEDERSKGGPGLKNELNILFFPYIPHE